jgi:hypothetical protein
VREPRPKAKRIVNREEAEAFAIHAVAHLASQEDGLERFSALSGIGIDEIKQRLGEPEFLGAVLDYVLYDDKLVIEISEAAEMPPESVQQARRLLPGHTQDYS